MGTVWSEGCWLRKWRAGTRETEVRLDGWCEGGCRQQRNEWTPRQCAKDRKVWRALSAGITVKRAQLLKIKAQISSIWAKGCMLRIVCVCVIWFDMTTPPSWREKVKVYYYIIKYVYIVDTIRKFGPNLSVPN